MTTLSIQPTPVSTNSLPLHLNFEVRDGAGVLQLAVENTLPLALDNWCLHIDLQRELAAGSGTLLQREGSHLRLSPLNGQPIEPGATCTLELVGDSKLLQRHSDLPAGGYLVATGDIYPLDLASQNLPAAATTTAVSATREQCPAEARLLPAVHHASPAGGTRPWTSYPRWWGPQACTGALDWLQHMLGQQWRQAEDAEVTDILCLLDSGMAPEAFALNTEKDKITLAASTPEGFCRGAATLLQLLQANNSELPRLRIEDQPHYSYRGFMLDCARHYHSVDTLIELLDWMALFKLNHFHWHLTDDEAWRLEIKAFPQLTEIGAWRGHGLPLVPQLGSGPAPYGGYYSQDDVRRVIEAATQRGIVVVPEIDIPAHCRAAIIALPELLREPGDASEFESVQFFNDNVLNPALPGTYEFLDKVLAEICQLFPGEHIHMGCDEVPTGAWLGSPACQAMIAREGYTSAVDLQGHLMRYAQDALAAHGRTLMGWEEAAQGNALANTAPMCIWSSEETILKVAGQGYPVISCAAPRAYLDLAWSDDPGEPGLHWAGTVNLRQCYETAPFPAGIDNAMGIQANLWGELINSREKLEYMLFPRLLATAEWAWRGTAGDDWTGFRRRAAAQLDVLRGMGLAPRSLDSES